MIFSAAICAITGLSAIQADAYATAGGNRHRCRRTRLLGPRLRLRPYYAPPYYAYPAPYYAYPAPYYAARHTTRRHTTRRRAA
jgi:hypothetical protein